MKTETLGKLTISFFPQIMTITTKTSILIKSTRLPLKGTTNAAKHYANDLLYTFEP